MQEELKEFGLTDNEIKIYLALLRLGNASPTEISEKTGLHRSYVYDAMERLLEKGIASYVFVNNKKLFQPSDPRKMAEMAETRKSAIEKIIPELQRIMLQEKSDTKLEIHKGKGVLKAALNDVLLSCKRGDMIHSIGIDDEIYQKIDPVHLSRYLRQAGKKGIKERVISAKGSKPHPETKITEYRYLDGKYMTSTATWIYADKVLILTLGIPFIAIIIKNKDIANTYRRQFALLWKVAKRE